MKVIVLYACLFLSACQITQIVPDGGSIVSRSGELECGEASTCVADVENGSIFSDTFTAIPRSGYQFDGWKEADRFLCGGSTAACALEGIPGSFTDQVIELFLEPVFSIDADSYVAPTAAAGDDISIDTGKAAALSGTGSFGGSEPITSFVWACAACANNELEFDGASAIFNAPDVEEDTEFLVTLTVSDKNGFSSQDQLTITVIADSGGQYPIVDTNQTVCYISGNGNTSNCNGSGYDAEYIGLQPDYSVTDGGLTVTDNNTGLVWQQSSDLNGDGEVNYNDKRFQNEAEDYCNSLNLAGRTDWRLPDVKTAYSLILFSGKDASTYQGSDTSSLTPFLADEFDIAFGDTTSSAGIAAGDRIIDAQYASSTLYVSTTMNGDPTMFGVNYVDGRIKGYPTHIKEFYVRCVRGNSEYGSNDFHDNENGTVSDLATGLMWQKNDSEENNWDDAVAACESATTASHNDWRLPDAKELQSIVDYSRSPDTDASAAIAPVFNTTSFVNEEGETDWAYYWSSTTHVDNNGDGSNAVYVAFGRALGFFQNSILDVHGAGSQRSNDKLDVSTEPGAQSAIANGVFYYKGPQGDILRANNKVRCVRDQ